jgi:hypothetical protein
MIPLSPQFGFVGTIKEVNPTKAEGDAMAYELGQTVLLTLTVYTLFPFEVGAVGVKLFDVAVLVVV